MLQALAELRDRRGILTATRLPFRHSFAWLEDTLLQNPLAAAARMESLYGDLLASIGVIHVMRDGLRYTSAPWNLLVTRRWMLVVPRVCERFEGVEINALGFAVSLFVRDDVQLETIKRAGPMAALLAVSGTYDEGRIAWTGNPPQVCWLSGSTPWAPDSSLPQASPCPRRR